MASFFRAVTRSGETDGQGETRRDSTPSSDSASSEMSRAQLLDRLETMHDKCERYEKRFRDVVAAYKSLMKEHNALKATMDAEAPAQESTESTGATGDQDAEASTPRSSSAKDDQLRALREALSTVSKEKDAIVTRFQTDKRMVAEEHRKAVASLRDELEEVRASHAQEVSRLKEEREVIREQNEALSRQISTLQADLSQIKADYEAKLQRLGDASDAHVSQRTEDEWAEKDKLIAQLNAKAQAASDAELAALTQLNTETSSLREIISELESQLTSVRAQLVAAQSRGESEELLRMKVELRTATRQLTSQKNSFDRTVKEQAHMLEVAQARNAELEARCQDLEARLERERDRDTKDTLALEKEYSDLTALIGQYEAARRRDHATIAALRQEVQAIRDEADWARRQQQQQKPGPTDDSVAAASNQDWHAAALQVSHVASSGHNAEGDRSSDDGAANENRADQAHPMPALHDQGKTCVSASSDDGTESIDEAQMSTLQQRVEELRHELEQERRRYQRELIQARQHAEQQIYKLEQSFRDDLSNAQAKHAEELAAANAAAQKARERTMKLLADKDAEIAALRGGSAATSRSASQPATPLPPDMAKRGREDVVEDQDALFGRASGTLMHFERLEAERANERAAARSRLRELEAALYDAKTHASLMEEQAGQLKQEIRRLERIQSREGVNLEYVKNIVLSYLTTKKTRPRTLRAIATVLQFSPQEMERARASMSSLW